MPGHEVMAERAALAIDTCGANGAVALVQLKNDTDSVTCMRQTELEGRAASAQLMPAIQAMLREAAIDLSSLRAIVVVNGPGSFTGLRVGLSTAKGLAHASGVPVIAVSRLVVLASLARDEKHVALLDAGRNEFYARRGEQEWLASFEEIAAIVGAGEREAGEREAGERLVVAESSAAERLALWEPTLAGPLDACAAARAALTRLRTESFDDVAMLDANYLRRSDAELFARPTSARAQ